MNQTQQSKLKQRLQTLKESCENAVKKLQRLEEPIAKQVDADTTDKFSEAVGEVEKLRRELNGILTTTPW